ncbi:hypothetical protein HDU82_009012 [Entophlyctis luteolus]|nr:hypothetical protein HDU82_009012 [Entophlyctis luteolus]
MIGNLAVLTGPVEAEVQFYSGTSTSDAPYMGSTVPGKPASNMLFEARTVSADDMRGKEAQFTTDTTAFQPVFDVPPEITSPEYDWTDRDAVAAAVYPHVEALVKSMLPGCHTVDIFKLNVRSTDPKKHASSLGAAAKAHIDDSANPGKWGLESESVASRFKHHDLVRELVESADARKRPGNRVRIINLWIVLSEIVVDWPLLVADSRTVPETQLSNATIYMADRVGESTYVNPPQSGSNNWWYWSLMKRGEGIMIKTYDSEVSSDGSRSRCVHASFFDPRVSKENGFEGVYRKSFEARCFCIG